MAARAKEIDRGLLDGGAVFRKIDGGHRRQVFAPVELVVTLV